MSRHESRSRAWPGNRSASDERPHGARGCWASHRCRAWFERAIALDPRLAEAHFNIGPVYLRQGRLGEAARWFDRALQIHPIFIEARYNLARAQHEQGKSGEAAEDYARVLRGDPNHRRAMSGLAELYQQAGPVGPRSGP